MSLRYRKVVHRQAVFLRLFGVTPAQFEVIMTALRPLWAAQVLGNYKRPGRDFKLDLEDILLILLLYYRSYITQQFVGFLFGIDDSRVCRLIRRLEPLLAQIMRIEKNRTLTQTQVEELIIDATEQSIERPRAKQKRHYSGKKKRHTIKTEIRITPEREIRHVSKSRPGAVHDFTVYKKEPPVPPGTRAYADSGYQGLQNLHAETDIPYKKPKNKELTADEKEYNHALSRFRVKVENVLGQIKVFKIMSERYRNKRKRYNIKFKIIAGIVNLKNGFALA